MSNKIKTWKTEAGPRQTANAEKAIKSLLRTGVGTVKIANYGTFRPPVDWKAVKQIKRGPESVCVEDYCGHASNGGDWGFWADYDGKYIFFGGAWFHVTPLRVSDCPELTAHIRCTSYHNWSEDVKNWWQQLTDKANKHAEKYGGSLVVKHIYLILEAKKEGQPYNKEAAKAYGIED